MFQAMNHSYQYLTEYVLRHPNAKLLTVLDYGCGNGELVKLLRAEGIKCFGVDTFYEGASYPIKEDPLFRDGTVKDIREGEPLPFGPGSFDLIISNQVLEHIKDISPVLSELDRVLKTDGAIYVHFPVLESFREGHLGIPFSHWLKPYSKTRYLYMFLMRVLGFGLFKENRSLKVWTQDASSWIDRFCFYEPYSYYKSIFKERYTISRKEMGYISYRLKNCPKFVQKLALIKFLEPLYRFIFVRLGFVAVELKKKA